MQIVRVFSYRQVEVVNGFKFPIALLQAVVALLNRMGVSYAHSVVEIDGDNWEHPIYLWFIDDYVMVGREIKVSRDYNDTVAQPITDPEELAFYCP